MFVKRARLSEMALSPQTERESSTETLPSPRPQKEEQYRFINLPGEPVFSHWQAH